MESRWRIGAHIRIYTLKNHSAAVPKEEQWKQWDQVVEYYNSLGFGPLAAGIYGTCEEKIRLN